MSTPTGERWKILLVWYTERMREDDIVWAVGEKSKGKDKERRVR